MHFKTIPAPTTNTKSFFIAQNLLECMKPQEIKKQEGTYRPDRDKNKDVEFDKVKSMTAPSFLKGEAKKAFQILVD